MVDYFYIYLIFLLILQVYLQEIKNHMLSIIIMFFLFDLLLILLIYLNVVYFILDYDFNDFLNYVFMVIIVHLIDQDHFIILNFIIIIIVVNCFVINFIIICFNVLYHSFYVWNIM